MPTRIKKDADKPTGNLTRFIGHRINPSDVLEPTSPGIINPFAELTLQTYRTFPEVPSFGVLDDALCDRVENEAPNLLKQISRSISALTKLGRLAMKETELHQTHRQYQRIVARGELERKKADAALAGDLIGQQPTYTGLAEGLNLKADVARLKTDKVKQRFADLRAKYEAQLR